MTVVVDSSALVSVVLGEADAESILAKMMANDCVVSAVTAVEAGIVVEARQGMDASRDLELLIDGISDELVAVDAAIATAAVAAWRRFGKGRHPAGLNFGDCFSYGLARMLNAPLLFKGDDFSQTDIAVA